jgi:uncharacterized protein (DUF2336 family)
VLTRSEVLDDEALITFSKTKSLDHLLAISHRKTMSENLTDVLVQRGDQQVLLNMVRNIGARFSENDFNTLIKHAQGNDELADCVGSRPDLPRELFERLVGEASEVVRAKLKAERQFGADDVDNAISAVAAQLRSQADAKNPHGTAVQSEVEALHQVGKLDSAKVSEWAEAGSFEKVAASLALMAKMPV